MPLLLPLSLRAFVRVKKVQAALGLVFASFVLAHVAGAVATLVGPRAGGARLAHAWSGGRQPARQLLWIGLPLAAHVGAGAVAMAQERALRRKGDRALALLGRAPLPYQRRRVWSARVHRLAGLALPFVLAGHVASVRLAAGAAGAAAGWELAARLALLLLGPVVGYHLGYGSWMGLVNLGVLKPGRGRRWGRVAGAAAGASVAALTVLGAVAR